MDKTSEMFRIQSYDSPKNVVQKCTITLENSQSSALISPNTLKNVTDNIIVTVQTTFEGSE